MRRVLKWKVPVDDEKHPVGSGPVVLVGCQDGDPSTVYVWTEEEEPGAKPVRNAQVYGTGHTIPLYGTHAGSTQERGLVWHVYVW